MKNLNIYFGDIHNHCGASYGQGPVEAAIKNAKMQLDFVSITGHALWPDMPREQHGMERRIKYHENGFAKLANCWDYFSEITNKANSEGNFVSFLSYEMHSCTDGDRTILYRDGKGDILQTSTVADLHKKMAKLNATGIACIALPHHIGYKQGYRGVNWKSFNNENSPLVEFFSMHGCSDSDYIPYPYLHSMGPCDHDSTYSAGLKNGCIVGAMGSTDHHSAHPGSHGHGRLSVHADNLTRKSIWSGILDRRTVALTGDNIAVDFSLNNSFMGDVVEEKSKERDIKININGGGAIRCVEILKNETVLKHLYFNKTNDNKGKNQKICAKIFLEMGWGSRGKIVNWQGKFSIQDGVIIKAEPRFKGSEIVSPAEKELAYNFSNWQQNGEREIELKTRTQGNPTPVTNSNQGFAIEVEMNLNSKVLVNLNGTSFSHTLKELLIGARTNYLDRYGTPAYRLSADSSEEYECKIEFTDKTQSAPLINDYDVYRLRIEQYNKQWAWSSPIWIRN
jgi:hypothetical protein